MFSESVDPQTMKPKAEPAKAPSGFKAFSAIWTNSSGVDKDEVRYVEDTGLASPDTT